MIPYRHVISFSFSPFSLSLSFDTAPYVSQDYMKLKIHPSHLLSIEIEGCSTLSISLALLSPHPQLTIHKKPFSAFCLSRLPIVDYHVWQSLFSVRQRCFILSYLLNHLLKKYFLYIKWSWCLEISIGHRLCVYSLVQYSIDLSIYLYRFKVLTYCCFAGISDGDNNEINNFVVIQYFGSF